MSCSCVGSYGWDALGPEPVVAVVVVLVVGPVVWVGGSWVAVVVGMEVVSS